MPVGLTLASRPVMAWHCNTTSAWGSAVLRNGGASVQARASAAVLNNTECWTVANWVGNSVRSAVSSATPWSFVVARWFNTGPSNTRTVAYAQANLTVAMVFPGGLNGVSVNNSAKVTQVFGNSSSMGTLMLVARLNTLFAGHNVAQCVVSSNGADQLVNMASQGPGVFKPTNSTGAAWSSDDFKRYLTENYLVS